MTTEINTPAKVSRHIFYLPATNGKAEESIAEGERLIKKLIDNAIERNNILDEKVPEHWDAIFNKLWPGKECGLDEYEWKLEQVVDYIKDNDTLHGIALLHNGIRRPQQPTRQVKEDAQDVINHQSKSILKYQQDFIELKGEFVKIYEAFVEQFDLAQKFMALDFEKEDWISVETELPDKSGLYLIVVSPTNDIYISFYKKDAKLFQVWGAGRDPINDMKTTHWQSLPNQPANQTLTEPKN